MMGDVDAEKSNNKRARRQGETCDHLRGVTRFRVGVSSSETPTPYSSLFSQISTSEVEDHLSDHTLMVLSCQGNK
jgi:hypothetical protein